MGQSATRRRDRAGPQANGLRCRVRLADGRMFCGELPPRRHRALQLGMLHAESEGLVELAAGTRPPTERFRSAGACEPLPSGRRHRCRGWLDELLRHAQRIVDGETPTLGGEPRRSCSSARGARTAPRGEARGGALAALWLDVDQPDRLPVLWDFLAERPCQLLCESAGPGAFTAYWKLSEPLPAERPTSARARWSS